MVVGKVSEFIGSLYYLCVTLLRFKNIMKLKNYLLPVSHTHLTLPTKRIV